VNGAMSGREPEASEGLEYLRSLVRRQEQTGADFLDLNVDEISLRLEEQKIAMEWLVQTVQQMTPLPVSIDSSNIEIIRKGTRPGPTIQQSSHCYCGRGKRHAAK
jgi:cobalamin-dependent methionine synthase I